MRTVAKGNAVRAALAPASGSRGDRTLEVVLSYALFAALWITASDALLEILVPDPAMLMLASTVKGWLFVVLSSLLLYALVRRRIVRAVVTAGASEVPTAHGRNRSVVPVAVAALAILALVASSATLTYRDRRAKEEVRLRAVAELKAAQVGAWIAERVQDAEFLRSSEVFSRMYLRYREGESLPGESQLEARLEAYRAAKGYRNIRIFDHEGHELRVVGTALRPAAGPTRSAVRRAAAEHRVVVAEIRSEGDSAVPAQMIFVVTLPDIGKRHGPTLVLAADSREVLFRRLLQWPFPSQTAEVVLLLRDGLEPRPMSPVRTGAQGIAALRALRLAAPPGSQKAVPGPQELRIGNEPYLGVARPVPGTDWALLAMVAKSELYAEAQNEALWAAFAGVLVLSVLGTGFFVFRQRQQLQIADLHRREQAGRLRTLQLLDAISDGSGDAIVAKDLEGRYLLFNREAARITGRPPAEVLGRAIAGAFSPEEAEAMTAFEREVAQKGERATREMRLTTVDGPGTFLVTTGPLHDAAGAVYGTFGISHDITNRKLWEDRLRAERERLQLIVETMAEGLTMLDAEGRFIFGNAAAEALIGLPRETIIGRRYDDVPWKVFAQGDTLLPAAEHPHERLRAGLDHIEDFEVAIERPDGRRRVFSLNARAVRDASGAFAGSVATFTDVTAQKRAEAAVKESFVLVRAVQDSVLAHLAVLDRDGTILAVNEAWRRFAVVNGPGAGAPAPRTGVGEDYLATCRAAAGPASEHAAEALEGIRAVIAGERESFELEYPCHSPAEERWFLMSATPLRTSGGGAVVMHTNITERHRMEGKIRESEHKLRLFIENAPAAVAMLDRDMRYLSASQRWLEDYRLREDDVVGRSHYEVFPEVPERWKEVHRRCLAGAVERCEADPFVRQDGRVDWIKWEIRPWHDAKGEVGGLIIMSEDITARRLAEEELRKLSLAVEQSPTSIVITDLHGSIEYVNEAFTRISGYGKAEVLGRNPRILQSGRTPRETYAAMWSALGRGELWRGEFTNRRKNGEEYVEIANVAPVRQPDGSVTHYLAVKEDVTEKKRIGRELDRHRHHLEELVKERTRQLQAEIEERRRREEEIGVLNRELSAKGETLQRTVENLESFSHTVSHDLRAPLASINGFATLLAQAEGERLAAPSRMLLDRLIAGAGRMNTMIDDILAYSRADRAEPRKRPLDLRALAEAVVRELAVGHPAARVEIGELPVVEADETMVRQVLANLVSNALKFSSKREAPRVEVGCREVEGRPEFYVRDNGEGFDMRHAGKLFGMFQRLHNPSAFPGTGVGLAIVRRLVERHGGRIVAESSPGEGATFRFTLSPAPGEAA